MPVLVFAAVWQPSLWPETQTTDVHSGLTLLTNMSIFWKVLKDSFKGQKDEPLRSRAHTHAAHTNLLILLLTLHILPVFSPSLPHLYFVFFCRAVGFDTWKGFCASLQVFFFSFFIHNWFVSHNEGVTRRKWVSGRASWSDTVSK